MHPSLPVIVPYTPTYIHTYIHVSNFYNYLLPIEGADLDDDDDEDEADDPVVHT